MKARTYLCAGLATLAASSALAQSSDAILRRLDILERENAALRARVNRLEGPRSAQGSPREGHASRLENGIARTHQAQTVVAASSLTAELPTWGGFRVGAFGGVAAWEPQFYNVVASAQQTAFVGDPAVGVLGGVRLGYDQQFGSFVIGAEGDFMGDFGSKSKGIVDTNLDGSIDGQWAKTLAIGTLTGRVGLAVDRTMIYGVAGLGEILTDSTYAARGLSHDLDGKTWTPALVLGGGLEYALSAHWTVGAEGDYLFAARVKDNDSLFVPPNPAFPITYGEAPSQALAKFGANYKF